MLIVRFFPIFIFFKLFFSLQISQSQLLTSSVHLLNLLKKSWVVKVFLCAKLPLYCHTTSLSTTPERSLIEGNYQDIQTDISHLFFSISSHYYYTSFNLSFKQIAEVTQKKRNKKKKKICTRLWTDAVKALIRNVKREGDGWNLKISRVKGEARMHVMIDTLYNDDKKKGLHLAHLAVKSHNFLSSKELLQCQIFTPLQKPSLVLQRYGCTTRPDYRQNEQLYTSNLTPTMGSSLFCLNFIIYGFKAIIDARLRYALVIYLT